MRSFSAHVFVRFFPYKLKPSATCHTTAIIKHPTVSGQEPQNQRLVEMGILHIYISMLGLYGGNIGIMKKEHG